MYHQKPVTEMEANLHPLWNIICRNNIHDLVMGVRHLPLNSVPAQEV